MTDAHTTPDRLTPEESKAYKSGEWTGGLKRKTPMKRKRATPRKVKLPLFTCKRQRCTNPIRWHGMCALHARKNADDLFSRYIRARDGACQVCGLTTDLQCAHLISRRYFALRWNPNNAVALCIYDHKKFTENPLAWDRWCRERLGDETWEAMKLRAERGGMPDIGLIIDELRELRKEQAA